MFDEKQGINEIRKEGIEIAEVYEIFALVKISDFKKKLLTQKGYEIDLMQHRTLVRLKYETFDAREREPFIPEDLKAGFSKEGFYIVQFIGPVKESWKDAVKDKGVKFYRYLPEFSFIVKMDDDARKKVSSLNFVDGLEFTSLHIR